MTTTPTPPLALPALPESEFCSWMQRDRVMNAFPWGVGDPARWDHDGHWAAKGFRREPLFTADQMTAYATAAILSDRAGRGDAAGWVSVKDKWPPRHRHVWCLNRDGWQFEGCICYGMHEPFFTYPRGDGNASNTAPSWIDVTHWRELPAAPTREAS